MWGIENKGSHVRLILSEIEMDSLLLVLLTCSPCKKFWLLPCWTSVSSASQKSKNKFWICNKIFKWPRERKTKNTHTFITCFGSGENTVKPVLSSHSKINKTKVLKTNGSLLKAQSIAECSPWSILQYF